MLTPKPASVEGVLEPEPVAAPLPLLAERRAAGTVLSRGGTVRMARLN